MATMKELLATQVMGGACLVTANGRPDCILGLGRNVECLIEVSSIIDCTDDRIGRFMCFCSRNTAGGLRRWTMMHLSCVRLTNYLLVGRSTKAHEQHS